MSSSTMIADRMSTTSSWVTGLRTNCVTGVCSNNPASFVEELLGLELNSPQNSERAATARIITCTLQPTEVDHQQMLGLLVDQLAQAALFLWPDWFGGIASLSGSASENEIEAVLQEINEFRIHHAALRVEQSWFREAMRHCFAGRPPISKHHGLTAQVRQLGNCLRNVDLCVLIAVTGATALSGSLVSLARASEWLAKEAEAKVLLIVPTGTETTKDLSSIPFFSTSEFCPVAKPSQIAENDQYPSPLPQPESNILPFASAFGSCEQKHLVQPLIGRPHPGSPGEQMLAAALTKDAELSGLFQFNLPVQTTRGTRYLADLIWDQGRVVIEVDGFRHHSSRLSFTSDRRRDYELLISGYVVLRLPHDEVVADAVMAVEKIRDVVRWRNSLRGVTHAD